MVKKIAPAGRKTEFLKLLRAIRARSASYSFRSVQALLKGAGMPSANGWVPLLGKYEALNYADETADWDLYHETLLAMQAASILAGTTAIWLFKAPPADVADLQRHVAASISKKSTFFSAYPFPLTEEELIPQSFKTVPVSVEDLGRGRSAVVACGKRAYREREQLDPEDLQEELRAGLGNFQELIVVRSGFTQAYDRLVFDPTAGHFEIHLDLCCPLNTDELQQMQEQYIDRIKGPTEKAIGRDLPWLHKPINLFPRIAQLYKQADGVVQSLGHVTSTKSVKVERMRSQFLDLREELFHKKGRAAVNDTDAFSIKKGWPTVRGNVPAVFIPGHSAQAGAADAAVRHAIIENCAIGQDFEGVVARLR